MLTILIQCNKKDGSKIGAIVDYLLNDFYPSLDKDIGDHNYTLFAAVNHIMHNTGGHFTATVKSNAPPGIWCKYNDVNSHVAQFVNKKSRNRVLVAYQQSAIFLFYIKNEATTSVDFIFEDNNDDNNNNNADYNSDSINDVPLSLLKSPKKNTCTKAKPDKKLTLAKKAAPKKKAMNTTKAKTSINNKEDDSDDFLDNGDDNKNNNGDYNSNSGNDVPLSSLKSPKKKASTKAKPAKKSTSAKKVAPKKKETKSTKQKSPTPKKKPQ
jgi:hypothetical protein